MTKNYLKRAAVLVCAGASGLLTAQTPVTLTFTYTGLLQTFTVPSCVSSMTIDARGGQGGGNGSGGGLGARMVGTYTTAAGMIYTVVVGQQGQLQVGGNTQNSSGGGGGSFVYSSGPSLVVAAGGGGGKCNYSGSTPLHAGADGTIVTSGNQASSSGALGGTSGQGGAAGMWASSAASGGGAGWLSAGGGAYGGSTFPTWGGGPGFCNGGGGGCGGVGGFGGGGGGGNLYGGGGGGGGYSGGGGGTDPTHGGGGGSFSNGTNQNNTSGYQTGNGIVIVTYVSNGPGVIGVASQTEICVGQSVNLTASNVTSYTWSTGSQSTNISVTPSVTTTYTAFGTNNIGCVSNAPITIKVNQLPVIGGIVTPSLLCVGSDATITATGAASYTWTQGGNSASTTVNPQTTTVYSVAGTSTAGCVNSGTVAVNVNSNTLTVTANTAVCAGHPVSLSASGATAYVWSTGAPFANITVTPAINTTYSVTGMDTYGCQLTGNVTVTVNPNPNVTLTSNRMVACKGESVTLTAGGASNYTINGTPGQSVTVGLPLDVPTSFTVAGESAGCSGTATVLIQVNRCNGIDEVSANARLSIYPNPAVNGKTVIRASGDTSVEMIDVTGKVVMQMTLNAGNNYSATIDGLSTGIYFVRTAASLVAQKVIVY